MRTIILLCLTTLLFALEQNSFHITHNPKIKPFLKTDLPIQTNGLRVDADGFLDATKESEFLLMEGEFVFSTQAQKELFFDLTWAKALLYIDNKEAVVIEKSTELLQTFEAGKHHIKIKVLSLGNGIAFVHVGMQDVQAKPLSDDELKQKFKTTFEDRDIALNYVYHFKSKTLALKESDKESVLFLSSLRPAVYTVKNIKKAKLKMIVYSGMGVEFKCDDLVEIVRVTKVPQAVELYPDIKKCSSFLGGLICPNEVEFKELQAWLSKVANRTLSGFSHPREQQIIPIPAVVLDEKMQKKIDLAYKQVDKKRAQLTQASTKPLEEESGKRWFETLKIKEKDVPQNSFRAFYMTKHRPDKVAYSEVVKNITIDYSHKLFHGIDADDFLALWVGDFYFDKETTQDIGVAISWAKVKIIDNGKVIYEGSEASTISHKFSAGTHRIEVEYINNYGQVDVNIGFAEPLESVADNALQITPETQIYLFGSYESRRSDHKAELFLKNSAVPTVLFLTSYETINYDIKNSKNAKLKAIVCNAYEPVGEVKVDSAVPVYKDKNLPYTQRIIPFSFDPQKMGFEGEREFANTAEYIKKFTGRVPDGFSSTETPAFCEKRLQRADENKAVMVPQIKLDEKVYKKIDEFVEKLKQGVVVESADCR